MAYKDRITNEDLPGRGCSILRSIGGRCRKESADRILPKEVILVEKDHVVTCRGIEADDAGGMDPNVFYISNDAPIGLPQIDAREGDRDFRTVIDDDDFHRVAGTVRRRMGSRVAFNSLQHLLIALHIVPSMVEGGDD